MSTSTSSLLPLMAVGIIWYYLSSKGSTIQTIWLALNVLDTLRALRHTRPNGRRIGINTRKKAMRESLICWTIYVVAQTLGPAISTLLGWIPFYAPVKAVICVAFLFMRLSVSSHIFYHILTPAVRPYETPVDLSVLLIQSIGILLFHYILQIPFSLIISTLKLFKTSLKSSFNIITNLIRSHSLIHDSSESVEETHQDRDTPTVDEDHIRASFLSPPPQIPGSILLRHPSPRPITPRRSISFLDPPATPKILPPPTPSSPEYVDIASDGPRTPLKAIRAKTQNNLLEVDEVREIRRSPRRSRVRNEKEMNLTDVDTIGEIERERKKPGGSRAKNVLNGSEGVVNPDNMVSSSKKEKGKAIPTLIIPDEDEIDIDEMEMVVAVTTKPSDEKGKGRGKASSFSSAKATQPDTATVNLAKPSVPRIPRSKSISTATVNTTTTSSRLAQSKITSGQMKIPPIPKRSAASFTSTTKPKTPRKTRILKPSEGGVAHDKPLSTAASRAKARTTAKAKVEAQEQGQLVSEVAEEGRKVGEKRRSAQGEVKVGRKRVKKE
ncbi:hypothetical protein L486_02565 [Kwoniella mangroviensis CBS 10435]|uniref:Uncharacterized protein n=1 Tax=Kwoniella mangroviensis CBS 10435 TaxID=1331196 RepID=A0A1B9IWK2_9TREE|nr:uncharacterized protein I203_01596 [Kwoniella mangroviensis CBS 8507]OCF59892.1 hypothetical protein L486_02565 [Kwoniella mangroviensis CBS 10435]OCF69732.1 hypothetical protein I203_01596 [Kwoniella mangroviensis CBS 8507]